ncbi:lysophospholipid acyltransferase family protein, partial [Anaeromyxobacter oryzisoli]|uniref:lysophospholipid acyltransferase family protein n=1 Tax=Anaeromyxobacter oryzisoli TaxID=2925408 RepID=UPI001F57D9DE
SATRTEEPPRPAAMHATPAAPAPAARPLAAPAASATAAGEPRGQGAARDRLVEVERKVEEAFDGVEARVAELAARAGVSAGAHELRAAMARLLPALRDRLGSAPADLGRLLEPPERLDRDGMDPLLVERAAPLVELLYASWWRTTVRGIENVPATGPAIVVANHAGVVPWDALVLRHALRRDHPAHRELRPLLEDREVDAPVIGGLAVRLGAVRSRPEAALRLLSGGAVLGVFPEGSAGARKAWRDRYRIQRFGRGGFVKIALRAGATIVPCAVVGSEEAAPGISRTGWLAERLGLPLLAANPALRLGAAAVLPLPARWSLRFGAPLDLSGRGTAAAEDPAVVNALTEQVRAALQAMLDEDVAARTSVFL